ncbi:MAG: radical SAM protein, partial [candidate division Zixibacteria bacterium]|nr:radical SAM protein [candidate division Zixibacteria bacterium]
MKTDILGHNFEELEDAFIGIGEKRFRGKQIAYWLYKRNVVDFEEMANLSKALREKLAEHFTIGKLKPLKTEDDETGTSKTLWELADGETIESVLIPDENRLTLCVSTQVGCPLGCKFCATGNIGYKRNLTAGEIMNQFLQSREKAGERISNIVFMGMGEPLLNLDNLSKVL